jgi:hypothetical protein
MVGTNSSRTIPPLAAGAVGVIPRLVVFGGGYAIKVEDRADGHGVR